MKLSHFLFALLACLFASAWTVNCQEVAEATEDVVATAENPESDTLESADTSATLEKEGETSEASTQDDATASDEDASSSTDEAPVQSGPFIDLLGPTLLSLERIDETHVQLKQQYTNDALSGKHVVGLYFR